MAEGNPTPAERIAKHWGDRLRSRRVSQGVTQVTLAKLTHYTQTTISRYERGEAPWTPEAMLCFAAVLGCELSDLFPWPPGIVDAERYRRGVAV